jgi:hypothetical protein
MAADLRDCCQRSLLDGETPAEHYPRCSARAEAKSTEARVSSATPRACTCGHVEVLHAIRGNGSRGACSISTGPKADPCGCPRFAPAPAVQDTTTVLADGPGVGETSEEVSDVS